MLHCHRILTHQPCPVVTAEIMVSICSRARTESQDRQEFHHDVYQNISEDNLEACV